MAGEGRARSYGAEQTAEFSRSVQRLRNETAGMGLVLSELAGRLTNARARTFANEGIGRRLPLIARGACSVFDVYPPNAKRLLSRSACDEVAIQFQAFAINMYGLLDNIAWVCMLKAGGKLAKEKIGLLRKEIAPFLPGDLRTYVASPSFRTWFDDYGKVYRDSTAHRIPPYLPSRAYSVEEAERARDLHSQSMAALISSSEVARSDQTRALELIGLHERLVEEGEALGSNSLLIALSLTGEDFERPIYLHPQLLCDWALAVELVRTFDQSIRKQYGWPVVAFPEVHMD